MRDSGGAETAPPEADERACGEAPITADADEVLVFFTCSAPGALPTFTSPVVRPAAEDADLEERLTLALSELLAGPTESEIQRGFAGALGRDGADIEFEVSVEGDSATVSFGDLRGQVSTTASTAAVISSLRATIFQFDELQTAELRIDGSCVAFWTLFESLCNPLTR